MKTKKCFKCGKRKKVSQFYKHKEMKDGYLNKCKKCAKIDVTNNRWKNIEKIRAYDRKRGYRQSPLYTKQWRKKNPEKYAAYIIVAGALKSGKIKKQPCQKCGATKKLHAHHKDYTKPLDVTWLCAAHHRQLTIKQL